MFSTPNTSIDNPTTERDCVTEIAMSMRATMTKFRKLMPPYDAVLRCREDEDDDEEE